jgi:hypothetical protein
MNIIFKKRFDHAHALMFTCSCSHACGLASLVFKLGLEMVNSQIYKVVILFLTFIKTIIKIENIKINSII